MMCFQEAGIKLVLFLVFADVYYVT